VPSLGELALWVAAEEYPDLDVPAYLARFDYLAQRVTRLGQRLDVSPAELLAIVLGEEQGFHGNVEAYNDPRNSFLNDVLDRRCGIPISLSILYIEVARRAGISAEGIGFPGHFLLRVGEGEEAVVIDPFHGGRRLSMEECASLLAQMTGGQVPFAPELLEPVNWRRITYRLLANLKNIYLSPPQDEQRALSVVERMLLVQPGSTDDLRDRALLLYRR
jgi:regulator of sirC expression with transglutaminase-like and TPR domain